MSTLAVAFELPSALIGRADLARIVREVETIDSDLETQKVRGTAKNSYKMPTMSRGLSDLIELNKINISDDQTRMTFKEQLKILKEKAPIIHMTFAVDADPESLQKLTEWIRQTLHPQALISVGLQPALIGGVYIRTPNHVHDFSMRALFASKRTLITEELEALRGK